MEFTQCTIDKIHGKKVLVVSFCGTTPHLEVSLEICRRLCEKNIISYAHLGNYVSRPTMFSKTLIKRKIQLPLRINRARKYLEKYSTIKYPIQWISMTKIVRNMLDIYHQKSENFSFDTLEELQQVEFDGYNIGIGVASTIITEFGNPNPFPLSNNERKEVFEQLNSAIKSLIFAKLLLNLDNYDCVVLFNGRLSCEHAFKQVAMSKSVKLYYHERVKGNTRYFFEEYQPHFFNKRKQEMALMNLELSKDIISYIGEDFFKRKVLGEGIYENSYLQNKLDYISNDLSHALESNMNKKIISYFTSSDDEYQSIDGFSSRYPYFKDQKSAVLELSKVAKSLGHYLVVRVHPNLKSKHENEQRRWNEIGECIKNDGFYWISEKESDSSYELVKQSSLVITAGSTIGVEAVYLNTPSIVITNSFFNDIVPSIKLVESKEDLMAVLSDNSTSTSLDPSETYIYGAWIMNYGPEFKYFVPTHEFSVLYGLMKDGTRIASPGISQRIIEIIKYISGKRGAYHLTV